MTAAEWSPFYFDGNLYFGCIESREDWQALLAAYHGDVDVVLRAKWCSWKKTNPPYPAFGLYGEYTDEPTLGQWADEQGMDLSISESGEAL